MLGLFRDKTAAPAFNVLFNDLSLLLYLQFVTCLNLQLERIIVHGFLLVATYTK